MRCGRFSQSAFVKFTGFFVSVHEYLEIFRYKFRGLCSIGGGGRMRLCPPKLRVCVWKISFPKFRRQIKLKPFLFAYENLALGSIILSPGKVAARVSLILKILNSTGPHAEVFPYPKKVISPNFQMFHIILTYGPGTSKLNTEFTYVRICQETLHCQKSYL